MSSSQHSLHVGSSAAISSSSSTSTNRSLAAYEPTSHQPTSPFSSHNIDALAPPTLLTHRYAHQHTTPVTNGFEAEEPRVYRSVTMEAPSLGGASGTFDPLSNFDAYHHNTTKDLSMNPKQSYGYATYQPTLNFATVQKDMKQQQQQQKSAPPAVVSVTSATLSPLSATLPPAAPMWLEPNSHFYCSCATPSVLYETVLAALQSLHEGNTDNQTASSSICTLDCTPTPHLYKMSCTAYQRRSGAATPFIVRIFTSAPEQQKYCVEFQRRQGDVVHFYELFRTARTRIQATHPCPEEKAKVESIKKSLSEGALDDMSSLDPSLAIPQLTMRSWSAPSLPTSAGIGASFNKEHICETVRSLLQMCASPCVDIKQQGVLALAELSCSPSFDDAMKHCSFNLHEVLVAEGCFQLFLDCLPLECQDIHRASLTALANLVETQSHLSSQVISDEKLLTQLYALTGSSTNQVVRECARFLAACAKKLGPELLRVLPKSHKSNWDRTLEALRHHPCSIVANEAGKIHQCVNGADRHANKNPIQA